MIRDEVFNIVDSLAKAGYFAAKAIRYFEQIEKDKEAGKEQSQELSNVDEGRQDIIECLITLRRRLNKFRPSAEEMKKADKAIKLSKKAARAR